MFRRIAIFVSIITTSGMAVGVAEAGAPKDDWPRINGQLWINSEDKNASHSGSIKNDELLGGHGNDEIYGRSGHDVIWGDHKASGQGNKQKDVMRGGPGDDWIYASHGRNTIYGGGGDDTIRVWFGRGFVDCGKGGDDILYVSKTQNKKVKRRHCERVLHKSARDAIHDRDGHKYD
jgi:Ca2+-binding RTX toxin-like protein